jgi:hypothetical protein
VCLGDDSELISSLCYNASELVGYVSVKSARDGWQVLDTGGSNSVRSVRLIRKV